jgi:uncharacterized Tic20 family protein
MTLAEEIEKLAGLHQAGKLTDDEFAVAKAALLRRQPGGCTATDSDARMWAMAIHLSLLAGYAVPLAGFVVPIILWQVKKDDLPGIDVHGRIVANWMLSSLIYFVLCLLLLVIVIGVPLLVVLGVLTTVFPIIGAVKASGGHAWRYPLSIRFFG